MTSYRVSGTAKNNDDYDSLVYVGEYSSKFESAINCIKYYQDNFDICNLTLVITKE